MKETEGSSPRASWSIIAFFSKKRKMVTKEEGIVQNWSRGLEQGILENQMPLGWHKKGVIKRGVQFGGGARGWSSGELWAGLWPLCPEMEQSLEARECINLAYSLFLSRLPHHPSTGFFLLVDLILFFSFFFPNASDLHIYV